MKNKLLTLSAFLIMLSFYIVGCDDEDFTKHNPVHQKTSVQFALKQQAVAENAGDLNINLTFSATAKETGVIKIKVDTSLVKHFTTVPDIENGIINLSVSKDDVSVSFKIKPNDNSILNGDKLALFRISEVSDNFTVGLQSTFSLTIKDNESPAQNSHVNFIDTEVTVKENNVNWHVIQIHVSESVTANGAIVINAQPEKAVYNTHYITEPAFANGRLELPIHPGTSVVSFKVKPVDDALISGNVAVKFDIAETQGNIKKGTTLSESFHISDDELEGMPMGYETAGGGWGMKKTYEYNAKGNIAKVLWETYTPYLTSGTDTYYYNDSDQLVRINTSPVEDIKYYWEDGKIVKQEKVRDGVVRSYIEFGYDEQGNVGVFRSFYLQPDGTFALSDITLLLYYADNNLYKKIVYYPDGEQIISETTFDNYIDKENPFPMVQVLPNLKTQKKLPTTYSLKANGHDLLYYLSYEFRSDGKVGKRTATLNGSSADVAVYRYY
jgi:hypothetical protein